MPRTQEGFAFDECGVNNSRVTSGLVLRESEDKQYVLVTAARQYQTTFFDTGHHNNCLHTNPSAGDLLMGQTAQVNGSIHLLKADIETAIKTVAQRYNIPVAGL